MPARSAPSTPRWTVPRTENDRSLYPWIAKAPCRQVVIVNRRLAAIAIPRPVGKVPATSATGEGPTDRGCPRDPRGHAGDRKRPGRDPGRHCRAGPRGPRPQRPAAGPADPRDLHGDAGPDRGLSRLRRPQHGDHGRPPALRDRDRRSRRHAQGRPAARSRGVRSPAGGVPARLPSRSDGAPHGPSQVSVTHGGAADGLRSLHVVGTGLIGTSIGLAARAAGLTVTLADADEGRLDRAVERGAGVAGEPGDTVSLAVAAVPPRHVAEVVSDLLR